MAQSLYQQSSLYFQRVRTLYDKPEVRASLEVILSVFAVVVLTFLAIRPTITNVFALQKKIEDQNTLTIKADNKIKQLLTAQETLDGAVDQLPLYDEAVPDSFTYYDYLARIETVATKNGLRLESLNLPGDYLSESKSPTTEVTKSDVYVKIDETGKKMITVNFSVVGSQANILNFLLDLENMDRVAIITSLDITKTKKVAGQTESSLTGNGRVTFYTLNIKSQTGQTP